MAASIKTPQEIEAMREGGKILAFFLAELKGMCKPGITTMDLEQHAEKLFEEHEKDITPGFKGYNNYPYILCTSVNENVVHTFPSDLELKEGDIINIDCGLIYKKLYTDAAVVTGVGEIPKKLEQFLDINHRALYAGIDQAKPGNKVGDISAAIEKVVTDAGYVVIHDLIGHGVGRNLHEPPQIPNCGTAGTGMILQPGMTLAIEPIIAIEGSGDIKITKNGWDIITDDGALASQAEHTVLITEEGAEILTQE